MKITFIEKEYPEAYEFLAYWYGAREDDPPLRAEEIAKAAALDQSPQLIQDVKRELKRLLVDRRLTAATIETVANWVQKNDGAARAWVAKVVAGLTEGERLRQNSKGKR